MLLHGLNSGMRLVSNAPAPFLMPWPVLPLTLTITIPISMQMR